MSSDSIIKVESLSKHYVLNKSQVPKTDTLYGSVINGLRNVKNMTQKKQTEDFWALQDVSFEVKQGDRVGIIGRNGAGKSTLLKILSRITPPTKGRIEFTGRMASLLEVGTGFHGDLSGRENIYLNGSILGMTKSEIDKKFDEIVDFAEVERFLDTPVKRYSSGMYVRLAFAVAANLEPDILIVDEVLAVGDAAFQKKCLGKMNEVSKSEGRTILFVSHSLPNIISLCNKGILLEKGKVLLDADINQVISEYNFSGNKKTFGFFERINFDTKSDLITSVELLDSNYKRNEHFNYNEKIILKIKTNSYLTEKFGLTIKIKNSDLQPICFMNSWVNESEKILYSPGDEIIVELENNFVQGRYTIDLICNDWGKYHVDNFWDNISFEIDYCKPKKSTIFIDEYKQIGSLILQNSKIYCSHDEG